MRHQNARTGSSSGLVTSRGYYLGQRSWTVLCSVCQLALELELALELLAVVLALELALELTMELDVELAMELVMELAMELVLELGLELGLELALELGLERALELGMKLGPAPRSHGRRGRRLVAGGLGRLIGSSQARGAQQRLVASIMH